MKVAKAKRNISISQDDKRFIEKIAKVKKTSFSGAVAVAIESHRVKVGRRSRRQLKVAL